MLSGQGLIRRLTMAVVFILFLSVSMVSAAPATGSDILGAVPADAWVAIEIKDLAKTSKILDDYATKLGTDQPAIQRRISRMLGVGGQLETNKPIVIVVMNKQTYGSQPVAVVLSVREYDNFAAGFKAKATETPGLMKGENEEIGQVFFTKKGPYVVMGPTEAIVNAVASSKQGFAAAMDAGSKKLQSDSDVYVRANLQALGLFAKPLLMGIGAMMQMSGMGMGMEGMGGEGAATQEGANPQMQAQMQALGALINGVVGLIDELNALDIGLKLSPETILASSMLSFKAGQEMAGVLALQKGTNKSLLVGLPGNGFSLTTGWQWQPKTTKFSEALMQINPGFTDPADIEKYKAIQKQTSEMVTGGSFKIDTRPIVPGEPMMAVYAVMETKDAKKYLDLLNQSLTLQSKIKVQAKGAGQGAEVQYKYEPDVLKADGVSVNRYTLSIGNLMSMPGVSGEDTAQIKAVLTMVLGDPTGVLKLNGAAVTDKTVAFSFGAAPKDLENFVKIAKSGTAPLSIDPRLIQTGKLLPRERFMEGYVDVGRVINAVMAAAMKMEGDGKPATMPSIATPLVGFAGTVEGPAVKVDAVIPFEVIMQVSQLKSMVPTTMPGTGDADDADETPETKSPLSPE